MSTVFGQNFFFSVLVFLECLEEYSKKKIQFLHVFATKSCFKVPVLAMPNEDDQELLSLGPEQAMTFVISVFHCFSIQNQSFFGIKKLKNNRVCMEIK